MSIWTIGSAGGELELEAGQRHALCSETIGMLHYEVLPWTPKCSRVRWARVARTKVAGGLRGYALSSIVRTL